jgi:hypothetical protein
MAPKKRSGIGKNRARGNLVPNIIQMGLNPLALEKEDEEDAEDFYEPDFKRRVANDNDDFDDVSEEEATETTTVINNCDDRISESFLAMETSSTSSTISTASTFVTPKNKPKRQPSSEFSSSEVSGSGIRSFLLKDSVELKDLEIGLVCFGSFLFSYFSINL